MLFLPEAAQLMAQRAPARNCQLTGINHQTRRLCAVLGHLRPASLPKIVNCLAVP
jgi:hypothetical protein